MAGTFDFCPDSHVAEEVPPAEKGALDMNGWEFVSTPSTPYRPTFRLTLSGLRWYLNAAGTALNVTTDPYNNAGRLLEFYRDNRKSGTFTYNHEFLGALTCRFAEPVQLPKAIQNSRGLLPDVEVMLVVHNPSFTL